MICDQAEKKLQNPSSPHRPLIQFNCLRMRLMLKEVTRAPGGGGGGGGRGVLEQAGLSASIAALPGCSTWQRLPLRRLGPPRHQAS